MNDKRWGSWRLSDGGQQVERAWDNPRYHYWVDLSCSTSSAQVLDSIIDASRKERARDDAAVADLVRALDLGARPDGQPV